MSGSDRLLTKLRSLQPRADRYSDEYLVDSWVPIPAWSDLVLTENQVVFGRRGSGKTHAFRQLVKRLEAAEDIAIYVDLRNLGSNGAMYGDSNRSLAQRSSALLIDLLEDISERLLDLATLDDQHSHLLPALEELSAATIDVEILGTTRSDYELTDHKERETSFAFDVAASRSPALSTRGGRKVRKADSTTAKRTTEGQEVFRLLFGPLSRAWTMLTEANAPNKVWLVLDEWTALPWDTQPIVADMIRRVLLPRAGVVVKIGSTEGASNFSVATDHGGYTGIQISADVDRVLSLDDSLRFDSEEDAAGFWAALLSRHIGESLAEAVEQPNYGMGLIFAKGAATEFVLAADGVPRDGISIIREAARIAKDGQITIGNVRAASRQVYSRVKLLDFELSTRARDMLPLIAKEVVAGGLRRYFLVDRFDYSNTRALQDLYEARLIHPVTRSVMLEGRSETFDVYQLDYSWFVSLVTPELLTKRGEPLQTLPEPTDGFPADAILRVAKHATARGSGRAR